MGVEENLFHCGKVTTLKKALSILKLETEMKKCGTFENCYLFHILIFSVIDVIILM